MYYTIKILSIVKITLCLVSTSLQWHLAYQKYELIAEQFPSNSTLKKKELARIQGIEQQ